MKGIGSLETVHILSIGLELQENRAGIYQDWRPQNIPINGIRKGSETQSSMLYGIDSANSPCTRIIE